MRKKFSVTQAGYQIKLTAEFIGNDLLLVITGGDTPHLGTVSIFNAEVQDVLQFPSHDGRFHKDDLLAEKLIENLTEQPIGNIVVTSGVHVNQITKEQIIASFQMIEKLADQLSGWFKNNQPNLPEAEYYQ